MAEHDIEKIVEAGGEVFNFRDPTKQPVADRVTSWSSTPSDAKYPSEKLVKDSLDGIAGDYRTKDQDISKGANLVVNGSGTMMSNYNFHDCTLVANTDLPVGIAGAFHCSYNSFFQDEFIQLNTEKAFYAEAWYRVKTANKSTVRLGLACYDIDKNVITAANISYGAGSLTELTQDLNPGDTVVHLADLSNSSWKSETTYHKGFIFWNYVNSFGYTYPPETYSRNVYPGSDVVSLWEDSTKVDEVNGTITLKSPWSGPVVLAGTKVSRRNSGQSYYYISSSSTAGASTEWTKLSGKFSGFASGGTANGAFKQGAAFFKLSWNNTYTSGNEWIEFAGIELRELPDRISTARKLKTNLARTADSTFDGSADQLNIPVTGTLPVGNGGTGKSSVTAGNYVVGAGTSAMVEKTPKDVGSDVLSHLDTDNGNVVDDDYIVGSYHVNETTISNNLFVRRSAVKLWNYIKSKLSGSNVNIGGNAATAGTADTAKAFDGSFTGTNSIASALNGKSPTTHTHKTDAADVTSDDTNLGDAEDTMQFVTTDAAGYDSSHKPLYRRPALKIWNWIKSKLASDTGYINFAHSVGSATNVNSHVLAGVVFADNSLHSCMFTFVMAVTFNFRESDECGGILKVDVGIDRNGGFYIKNISLSNVTGALSVGDFNLVVGEVLNRKVVGVTWNGVLKGSRYLRGTILSRYVDGDDTEFAYNNDVANGATQAWNSARQLADDSAVVHIAGSETITGAKEFSRSGQDTNFTDSSGAESIVRARTATNSNNGSCQLDAYASVGKYGLYARNSGGAGKWVANLDNDGVVNLGSSGDAVRIGGTKFVFGASQLGTDSNTFYWV